MFGVKEEELEAAPPLRRAPDLDYAPDLEELVERVERPQRRWLERAILLSLLVHAVLIILFLLDRGRQRAVELRAERAYVARRKAEMARQIPIKFFTEAPGPARREARADAPLSDKNRRAGGGDRNRPKAETPFVARQSGIEGLEPGPRSRPAPRATASAGGARPSPPQAKGAAPAPSEKQAANGFAPPQPSPGSASGQTGATGRLPSLNEAIRNATGGPAGLGGAPKANEGGGFVDYGPISFDTQWYDWGDYAEEMLRKIKIHWYEHIPKLAELGPDGKLTIRFYIRADGTVEGETVVRSSNIPPYDHAAFLGVSEAAPFRPLPKELNESREGITITFLYLHYRAGEKPPELPGR